MNKKKTNADEDSVQNLNIPWQSLPIYIYHTAQTKRFLTSNARFNGESQRKWMISHVAAYFE